ncbi:MAG: Snf7 family protein [Candidatus Nezhaarchaeota archaeon]|nr:Snf7 family protein [Candidatus Nezhaarchaeota archaeon]
MSGIGRFAKKWDEQPKEPTRSRVKSLIMPEAPLKRKIDLAMNKLKLQLNRLDQVTARLMERDKTIFERVVDAYLKHEADRATLYANELAELRKMSKIILYSKLSLEKVLLRLGTIKEVGDLVVAVAPAVAVIKGVRNNLTGLLPEAEQELNELTGLLDGVMMEAGQITGESLTIEASEEAQKILEEAMTVAEQKVRSSLPEIPASKALALDGKTQQER